MDGMRDGRAGQPSGDGAPPLDKTPQRIAGMFDAIAHRYDRLNHVLSAGLDRRWRRRAIASVGPLAGARVLDVCTGTADLAIAACRDSRPRTVLGVDFAGAMLALGRRKVQASGLDPRVRLVRGDACRLPCAAATMDAATIGFGIRNVVDPAQSVREIARVLKPGGRLAILEFGEPRLPLIRGVYLWYFRYVLPRIGRWLSRHADAYAYLPASVHAFIGPAALAEVLRDCGFDDVRAERLALGIVWLYAARKPMQPRQPAAATRVAPRPAGRRPAEA